MRATSKQIAFLNFLGYPDASSYTKDQAHDLISDLVESEDAEMQTRCAEWRTARFVLYPRLYAQEREQMNELFHEPFRHFVRERIVGASERLTYHRISEVIDSLHEGNPLWWKARDRNELMLQRLAVLFPRCCDGAPPKPRIYAPRPKATPPASSKPVEKRGCASLLLVAIFIGLT